MANFKVIDDLIIPPVNDDEYWKRLRRNCTLRKFGAIDYIDFYHLNPYEVAVTFSDQVQICNTAHNKILCRLDRFVNYDGYQEAYGGVVEKYDRIIAAGSEDGKLRIYNAGSKRLIRCFKGHSSAVHRCSFTWDSTHVVSFSDDRSIALWSVPCHKRIKVFDEHEDYVRAGIASQDSEHIFLSGSYDHSVKMFDSRTACSVMTVDHGVPVESVLMFPFGKLFISAGGTNIKVWDSVAGRLLTEVSQHQKTVTCLCFAGNGQWLMTGSLDRNVKIYDVTSYKVVHTLNYPSPILSLSVAPQDKMIAVGMTDGLLSLSQREESAIELKKKANTDFKLGNLLP